MRPHGIEISDTDDFVYVLNEKDEIVYQGIVEHCPYNDEPYKWNEADGSYELANLPGYHIVCCG